MIVRNELDKVGRNSKRFLDAFEKSSIGLRGEFGNNSKTRFWKNAVIKLPNRWREVI